MPSAITTQTIDVTIRAEVLDGTWESYGVDRVLAVDPESLVYSSNEWGYDKASFTLRRLPWASWPDLQPYTPVEIELGGVVVWEGRTNGTPLKAGVEQQVNVQCEGWQYALDDELYQRAYVSASLTTWRDSRSLLLADLTRFVSGPTVGVDQGAITLGWANGTPAVNNNVVGVTLDLGQNGAASRVVLNLQKGTVSDTTIQLYAWGHATENMLATHTAALEAIQVSTGEGIHAGTFATAYRYVTIFLIYTGAGTTFATDQIARLSALSIFGSTVFESGNVSVLRATTVAIDALERGAPAISADHTQIATAEDEFNIPSLLMASYRSPREMIEAVNAFHDWTTKIDRARRLVFAPRPSEPTLEFGSWSGEEIEDTSAGDGSEIFNECVVEGTAANGAPLAVVTTSTGSVLSRRESTRAKAVQVANLLTQAMGEKLGEVFLDSHEVTPFAGSIRASVGSIRRALTGQPVHPSLLPGSAAELIRVSHMIDPDTGGVGRDGLIVGVTYTHATQMAEVSLSNRLDNFDPLLERLAAVEGAGA